MTLRIVFLVLSLTAMLSARSETMFCPKLATAAQIGNCPGEEELKYTFNGYCSDNARMYDKDTDLCTDYRNYRRIKNTAPWEAGDGAFQAYLSCDLPAAAIATAEPSSIAIVKQGKITKVVCTYRDGIAFAYRTRAECKVEGDGKCTPGSACKATCD